MMLQLLAARQKCRGIRFMPCTTGPPSPQSSRTHSSLLGPAVSSITVNSVPSAEDEVTSESDLGVDVPDAVLVDAECATGGEAPPGLLTSPPANAGRNTGGMTFSSVVSNVTLEQCEYQPLPLLRRMAKHHTIQSSPSSFTKTAGYAICHHWSLSSGN